MTAALRPGAIGGRSPGAIVRSVDGLELLGLPALTALAVALAAWPWLRAHDVPGTAGVLVVAAVAPVAIALGAGRVLRQSPVVSYGLSLLALVVVVAAAISVHPSTLSEAIAHAPTRLLTDTLPLSGDRTLLLPPLLVVWVTGAVTAEILTRSRRSAPALMVPLASYLVAFGATAGAPRRDDLTGAWLLGALALLAFGRRRQKERSRITVDVGHDPQTPGPSHVGRRGLVGVALALVVAAGLGAGVPHLRALSGHQASVRRQPATTAAPVVDPVDAIEALRDADPGAAPTTLLSVTTSAASTGYLGLASLADYDGDTWSFDTTFEPTGGRIPAGPESTAGPVGSVGGIDVIQQYRLVHSDGLPFIPMLDRPTQVSGLTVDADAATGMVVPAGPVAIPSLYTVQSLSPGSTIGGLPAADSIDRSAGGGEDLAVPSDATAAMATTLRFLASISGQTPTASVGFLQAVVAALERDERRVTPNGGRHPEAAVTNGGTSLAEVVNAVTVRRQATPEQFATLFVMAARQLGVPARLVTGFRAGATAGRLPAGTTSVTNREGWTWAEVPVVGVGWVVVDPTPSLTATRASRPPAAGSTTVTTLAPPRANAVPNAGGAGGERPVARPVVPSPGDSAAHRGWVGNLLLAVGALVVLLGVGPVTALVRRLARRRSRHSTNGAELAVGAWLELLDSFDRAGLRTPRGATTADVTAQATKRFGAETVDGVEMIAALADRAVYCVDQPPDGLTARTAWQTQAAIRHRVLRSMDVRRRARALVAVGHQPRRPVQPAAGRSRGNRPIPPVLRLPGTRWR